MAYIGDHKPSFSELLDEEYAKKLQQSFEDEVAYFASPSQEEKDFLLALQLSQESATSCEEEKKQEEQADPQVNDQLSEDYLIALQLQDRLIEEDRDYHQILRQNNGNSHVQVTTGYERLFEEGELFPRDNEDEGDRDDEDDYDYDEYDTFNYPGSKGWNKPNGRLNTTDFTNKSNSVEETSSFTTKHDSELCGNRNAQILETQISIDCGNMMDDQISLPNPVFNELNQHAVRSESRRIRKQGKEDYETCESVMDSQTRLLLYKMLNSNIIKEIGGIISSGKEANVYSAVAGEEKATAANQMYAIKIYKTTLNEFKNRDDYIKDDYRFRYRFNKQSSRKFIKVWAEKEMENLNRMKKHGISCPSPIHLRKNVLVMDFIGNGNKAAPQLRHTSLSIEKLQEIYVQCIKMIRVMFQRAHLVHGDLSEYNILYYKSQLYFIDVAQAVEHEHPNCLAFLRRDCDNVSKFFVRSGLKDIMTTRELFNYVTDINITDDNEDLYLDTMMERCANRTELSLEDLSAEKVFMDSYIPRHLDHISDPFVNDEGEVKDVFHQSLTGMKEDLSGASSSPLHVNTDELIQQQTSPVPPDSTIE